MPVTPKVGFLEDLRQLAYPVIERIQNCIYVEF